VFGEVAETRVYERISAGEAARSMTRASQGRVLSRAVCGLSLLVGAAGLLGCPGYFYVSRAYFTNSTREPVKVRVQQLAAEVECTKVEGRSAELLAHRELFADPVTYEVPPGEALPLDLDDEYLSGQQGRRCAALVQVLGFPDQVVFWRSNASSVQIETKRAELDNSRFVAQSLTLEGYGEVKGLAAGKGLEVTALPPLAARTEALVDSPALLGWSGTPRTGAGFVLQRRSELPDGCWSLLFEKGLDADWPLFLCAPGWSFPFEVGDEVAVTAEELVMQSNGYGAVDDEPKARHLTISGARAKLVIWLNASKAQVPAAGSIVRRDQPGRRTACGAYVEPLSVELPALKLVVAPGEEVEAAVSGRHWRVLLGRADDVLVAPDTCGAAYSSLGARFDLLMLDEPAETTP
jgi:hypothetical protein